jgi:hypothetical protein
MQISTMIPNISNPITGRKRPYFQTLEEGSSINELPQAKRSPDVTIGISTDHQYNTPLSNVSIQHVDEFHFDINDWLKS